MFQESPIVTRYVSLGLALGRHVEGLVDAYYGPLELADRAAAGPPLSPSTLVVEARRLLADIEAGVDLDDPEGRWGASVGGALDAASIELPSPAEDAPRRRWIAAQVTGLMTTASTLAGESIGYADEVESCYGVRPRRVPEDQFVAAHRLIDEALPGRGSLMERRAAWIEAHQVVPGMLRLAIASMCADLRERTAELFGLPDGEQVDFELVDGKPWSGFNYYLGNLHSRVAINTDVPVLSTSIAHLVAHEAYPGHHTEHTHKEVGLVRRRRLLEETIFLVGTPQCLLAEGLADLGLEVVVSEHPEGWVADHLVPIGIRYDAEVVRRMSEAAEVLSGVRATAAFRLHEDRADPETVTDELARWSLIPRERAAQAVKFLIDPTWRAYITCYVEGLPLTRRFVGGDPARFARLLEEHLVPADLAAGSMS